MKEAVEEEREPVGNVFVEIEAFLDNGVERNLDKLIRFGNPGGSGGDGSVEQPLPVKNLVEQHRRLHVTNGLETTPAASAATVLGVPVGVPSLQLGFEETIKTLVKIKRKRPDKGGVIPGAGVGVVSEAGEIENLGAAFHGVKNFPWEIRISILKNAKNEHEGFQSDDPVAGAADPFTDGSSARSGVNFVGGDEGENVGDVAVVDRDLVVGGGLEDGHLDGRCIVFGNLGETDAGLVFDSANCLSQLAWHIGIRRSSRFVLR